MIWFSFRNIKNTLKMVIRSPIVVNTSEVKSTWPKITVSHRNHITTTGSE